MIRRLIVFAALLVLVMLPAHAQTRPPEPPYDIGTPVLTELYVDPVNGSDSNVGTSADAPFATLDFAWRQIPMGAPLDTGYRINLAPGNYPADNVPNYMEVRLGSFEHPIIITAAPGTATLASLNIYFVTYLYLIGLTIQSQMGDVLHCERCDHFLLRDSTVVNPDGATGESQETLKINQSQYVYIENSDIGGASDNAIDFVAVQYGHVIRSRIHSAGDWCMYVKGGSAFLRIDRNELYSCGTGGFTAGQGTGFQFMVSTFLQYEATAVQFTNNVLHDLDGAAFGVHGGQSILIEDNTAYRVGARSHVIEVGFGARSCDGGLEDPSHALCADYLAAGGWGNTRIADGDNFTRIPNRRVLIVNNVIYNPAPYQSQWQQFQIDRAYDGEFQAGSNVPVPTLPDDGLEIAGNIIWNGGTDHPLGIGEDSGCAPDNPTCNAVQLLRDNQINTVEPVLRELIFENFPPSTPTAAPIETVIPAGATDIPAIPQSSMADVLPAGAVMLATLGDSLTEGAGDDSGLGGYPGRLLTLIEAVRPGSTLLNLGQSGWNSDAMINGDQGVSSQLTTAIAALNDAAGRPAVALVWIGSNDLWYLYEYGPEPIREEDETADLENFSRNLDTTLQRLTEAGAAVGVALVDDQSLRPVALAGEAFPATTPADLARMSVQAARYNEAITALAAKYGAFVVDFYSTDIFTNPATLYDDGNHPNAHGYDVIAARWFAALEPLLR